MKLINSCPKLAVNGISVPFTREQGGVLRQAEMGSLNRQNLASSV